MGEMADLALSTHADGFSRARRTNKTQGKVSPYARHCNCSRCGSEMVKKNGVYGAFWGCSKFPKCKGSRGIS